MKTVATLIALLFISIFSVANDGVYLTRGGIIYPAKETKISLEKEILSFTVKDKIAFVDVYFEFLNPENSARKLLVGFQAPTAGGDVSDSNSNTNQISNFTIIKEGHLIPYKITAAQCEDCPLKEPQAFRFSQFEPGLFVFLFEITFEPGLNKIGHSYSFPTSSNVAIDQIYDYILTTGSKWAGNTIKDLTVQIDMGQNKYFYVSDIFGSAADWAVIGTGKVTHSITDLNENAPSRMVRTISGMLQIIVKDFKPLKNLQFGVISDHSFITAPTDYEKIQSGEVLSIGNLELYRDYTKEDLRLLRNTIYAQYGYAFKSEYLQKYFSQFPWYMPDPNLKMEDIQLTEKEREYVEKIKLKEKG